MYRKHRSLYSVGALLLFLVEVLIALYVHDNFVRPYLGDLLVVILIYCFLMAVSRLQVIPALLIVLAFSYLVEVLQAVHFIEWLGLQDYPLASAIIGTSFSFWDLAMYTLGAAVIAFAEWVSTIKPHTAY